MTYDSFSSFIESVVKVLFDQGTHVPLRNHLPNHVVETAYEKSWGNLKNGDLLTQAEAEGFDALITTDKNLRHQQNLSGRRLGVIVLSTTNWPCIKNNVALVVQAMNNLHPGGYKEVVLP